MRNLGLLFSLFTCWISATQTFAQELRTQSECPTVVIECMGTQADGAPVVSVIISGSNNNQKLSFRWKVSGMEIVSGQGTSTITLARPTLESHSFSAEIEVSGLPNECNNKAACGVVIEVLPKFDEFNLTVLKDADSHLQRFVSRLEVEPGARACIIIYGNPSDSRRKVDRLLARLKESLVKEYDIVPERIVVVNGGYRKRRSIELWVVPTGFALPKATPTVFLNK